MTLVARGQQILQQVPEEFFQDSEEADMTVSLGAQWELDDRMIRAYAQTYALDELRQINDFFESPAGQLFLDKNLLLTAKYLNLIQRTLTNFREMVSS